MTQIAQLGIAQIHGGGPITAGELFMIKVSQPNGEEVMLSFRPEQLPVLVELAAMGHTQCKEMAGANPSERFAYKAAQWEVAKDPLSNSILLTLGFGTGGRLSFVLPSPMPLEISEALRKLADDKSQPTAH